VSVTALIAGPLRAFSGAGARIPLEAGSVREALARLRADHPALYVSICDETGRVRRHVNVFVNQSHIRDRQGIDTPLATGDAIHFCPSVSGG
jgi:molybdopterin converting factor small subunit